MLLPRSWHHVDVARGGLAPRPTTETEPMTTTKKTDARTPRPFRKGELVRINRLDSSTFRVFQNAYADEPCVLITPVRGPGRCTGVVVFAHKTKLIRVGA